MANEKKLLKEAAENIEFWQNSLNVYMELVEKTQIQPYIKSADELKQSCEQIFDDIETCLEPRIDPLNIDESKLLLSLSAYAKDLQRVSVCYVDVVASKRIKLYTETRTKQAEKCADFFAKLDDYVGQYVKTEQKTGKETEKLKTKTQKESKSSQLTR